MATRNTNNKIWNYFDRNNVTKSAACHYCQKSISYKSTTTNLKQHLRLKHFGVFQEFISRCSQVGQCETNNLVVLDSAGNSDQKSKAQKLKSKGIYEIVKRNCIELVKIHGRPVELFDDEPFKNIIKLLPLTETQRASLSSESIKLMMDTSTVGLQDVTDDNESSLTTEGGSKDTVIEPSAVKSENLKCSCSYNDPESDQHELDCSILLQQPFWRFFDVTVDTAVCNLCCARLNWADISTLKKHMQQQHPNVKYKDDDDDEKSDTSDEASSVHSAPDMEEVYLENFDDDLPLRPPSTRKKRKLDDVSGEGPLKMSIQETVEMSLMKYKSLDRFGLYIGSLLKMLPAEKCVKFQAQIVQRLLQEQAAAG